MAMWDRHGDAVMSLIIIITTTAIICTPAVCLALLVLLSLQGSIFTLRWLWLTVHVCIVRTNDDGYSHQVEDENLRAMLLEAGADPTATNNNGFTAADAGRRVAKRREMQAMMQVCVCVWLPTQSFL